MQSSKMRLEKKLYKVNNDFYISLYNKHFFYKGIILPRYFLQKEKKSYIYK